MLKTRITVLALALAGGTLVSAQGPSNAVRMQRLALGAGALTPGESSAAALTDLRTWSARVDALADEGTLRVTAAPSALAGIDQRLEQRHRGVRVFGGGLTRHVNRFGQTASIFGTVFEGIAVDVTPDFDVNAAAVRLGAPRPGAAAKSESPELVISTLDGTYRLAYTARVFSSTDARFYRVFIDAHTGTEFFRYNDTWTQTASVGTAASLVGGTKKIATGRQGGGYVAVDLLRPPDSHTYLGLPQTEVLTFSFNGNVTRALQVLNTVAPAASDIASDADNDWTDLGVTDAHVYAGYTYDFYYKRFARQGLDNRNLQLWLFTNPTRPGDYVTQLRSLEDFFVNAAYFGSGNMFFGVGLPAGVTLGGQQWFNLAGGLDVVAHELTHGVTDYTSNLIYLNESGALNEAFSDMMGAAVEFDFQPVGNGLGQADWSLGEDVVRPGGLRSMNNPASIGDPDHYSVRYRGTDDGGGVHINSSIVNHMYYLAIMGGTNRVSGQTVAGVGFANRKLIENCVYRAFTALMPASATFSTARAATIQAARDLYGASSEAERALTAAWNAVGVQ